MPDWIMKISCIRIMQLRCVTYSIITRYFKMESGPITWDPVSSQSMRQYKCYFVCHVNYFAKRKFLAITESQRNEHADAKRAALDPTISKPFITDR